MNYGKNTLPVPKISQIHLSLIRTFRFCQQNSEFEKKFNFLDDRKKYFETVVEDIEYLGNLDRTVPGVGKLRSVLEAPEFVGADSFFRTLQEFYVDLSQKSNKKLMLTPHYPCAIDILPSHVRKHKVIASTLPVSLREANEVKMSFSMRIYPAGIASLRLGWFLSTDKNFKIGDIIDFLWEKKTVIEIDDEEFSVDLLSKIYSKKTVKGLIKMRKPPFEWIDTHSIIDIVDATDLPSSDKGFSEIFLPLLNLQKNFVVKDGNLENLSNRGDWLLPGKRSMVSYLPFAKSDCDRRKVRRWLRNFIELFSIQKSLISQIQATKISEIFRRNKQNWINKLKKGLLSPDINSLFSLWLYTQLHQCPGTLEKEAWRIRYQKSLKVLDQNDKIQTANDIALVELEKIKTETNDLESTAGKWLKSFIELLTEGMKAVAKLK